MRKKKNAILAIALCVALITATGCGGSKSDDDKDKTTQTTTEQAKSDNVTPKPDGNDDEKENAKVYGEAGKISAYDTAKTNYTLSIDAKNQVHDISELLYGIFIEDINFAADGGLYAEMVKNRSFEFTSLAANNEKHGWKDVGTVSAAVVKDDEAGRLNENNTNYMLIENTSEDQAGIANVGFLDGMSITQGAVYKFSVYLRGVDGFTGPVTVDIMNGANSAASGKIDSVTGEWKKYELTLTSTAEASKNVTLQLTIGKGKVAVDMVSLFPEDTYNGRANGIRKDLAEKLKELNPAFLRFPGGCVIEGNNDSNAYDWKDSIGTGSDGLPLLFNGTYGDVAARKQGINIWSNLKTSNDPYPSYMTYGLGFFEYFQLAEDIGAIGVPVVNCGLHCQVRGGKPVNTKSEEFQQYIQDALDLVEFCRGDETTTWGKVRVSLGHPEPFKLKYIGIGNENWGSDYFTRYELFVDAFEQARKEKPDLFEGIEIMYSAGVDDGDSGNDYMKAYENAAKWLTNNPGKTIDDYAGAIDHHYYNTPSWFLNNADYYDEENYSRDTDKMTTTRFGGGINVFLGEYAAQSNRLEAALAEAAYMTGLERNGDIVKMAAYAPLFGNLTATHWSPDLIWFNNHTVTCSISYYVQKIFSTNAGTMLLASELKGEAAEADTFKGKVGVGTWNTAAKFDNVKVVDNATGEVLGSEDFSESSAMSNWTKVSDGNWSVSDGMLVQSSTSTDTNKYGNTGSTVYYGNKSWTNYTFTVDAVKTSGDEGFLIAFSVGDQDNNFFWNIGGWGNTVSCLQQVSGGGKSDQLAGTSKNCMLLEGKTYKLKVAVTDNNVKCYINDELFVDYNMVQNAKSDCYHVVSTDETGDVIVKLVNVAGSPKTFAIDIAGAETIGDVAAVEVVAGQSLADDNILGQKEAVTLESGEITGVTNQFNYTVPKYSVTVLRIKTK